jgi:hypothetical protein
MGFQTYTLTGGLGSAKSDRDYVMSGEPVFLPIPIEGIQDVLANDWGGESVEMMHELAGQGLRGMGFTDSVGGLIDKIKDKIVGPQAGSASANVMSRIAAGWDQGNLGEQFSSQIDAVSKGAGVGAVATTVHSLGNAVQQSTGIAGFQETSVTYKGPQFRSFSFNFSLKPLTQMEQNLIEEIVRHFRFAAAPQEIEGSLYRIYSLPKVFEIKFYHKDGENKALPTIGKCALQNIGIKYGGDRFQTFATGHAPIQTDISLQFIELILQTQNVMGGEANFALEVGAVDDFSGMGKTPAGVSLPAGVPAGVGSAISADIAANAGRASDPAANRAANARQERVERDINV